MTDDDEDPHLVLLERLDRWLAISKHNPDKPRLLEYMGMTVDEFIDWRLSRVLPEVKE
jgi:hypothetical protein